MSAETAAESQSSRGESPARPMQRLASIDVYRGLVMFLMITSPTIITNEGIARRQ